MDRKLKDKELFCEEHPTVNTESYEDVNALTYIYHVPFKSFALQ